MAGYDPNAPAVPLADFLAYAQQVGFTGEGLATLAGIANRESGFKPGVKLVNSAATGSDPAYYGTVDRGILQFNSKAFSNIPDECAYDWRCAIQQAYAASKGGTSWGPWHPDFVTSEFSTMYHHVLGLLGSNGMAPVQSEPAQPTGNEPAGQSASYWCIFPGDDPRNPIVPIPALGVLDNYYCPPGMHLVKGGGAGPLQIPPSTEPGTKAVENATKNIGSVTDFLNNLTHPGWWVRAALVIGGMLVVYEAIRALTGAGPSIVEIAQSPAKLAKAAA